MWIKPRFDMWSGGGDMLSGVASTRICGSKVDVQFLKVWVAQLVWCLMECLMSWGYVKFALGKSDREYRRRKEGLRVVSSHQMKWYTKTIADALTYLWVPYNSFKIEALQANEEVNLEKRYVILHSMNQQHCFCLGVWIATCCSSFSCWSEIGLAGPQVK